MGYMKKYKCPFCLITKFVIRKTKRKSSILYLCKQCKKYFSIKTVWIDRKQMLSDHLDGLSFRDLSRRYDISPATCWRICEEELKKLPDNNQFTFKYCSRFSKRFVHLEEWVCSFKTLDITVKRRKDDIADVVVSDPDFGIRLGERKKLRSV